jgi:hypothetical protein
MRPCDGGHIGRVCGALVSFPQSVRYVVQGLPLLAELSTLRALKWPKGGGLSHHYTLGCVGYREVCEQLQMEGLSVDMCGKVIV